MHLKYIYMRFPRDTEASSSREWEVFTHVYVASEGLGALTTPEHMCRYVVFTQALSCKRRHPTQNHTREFPAMASLFPHSFFSLWYWDTQGSNRLFTPSRLQNSFYLRLPESAEFSCFESSQRSLQISTLWKVTCQGTHFSWLTTSI